MPDSFVAFSKAIFPFGGNVDPTEMRCWTPELIASLDWMRLAELVRSIASHAGCELAGSRVLSDGAVVFGMMEQPASAYPQRALVKITSWNEWGATPASVTHFAKEVSTAKNTRGILVAPAGFSTTAMLAAQQHRIETVDATTLCTVLKNLPPERSDLFFNIATTGAYTQPTCPVCLEKLHRVDAEYHRPPEVQTVSARGLYAEHIRCDFLEIVAQSEVEFLYPVQARSIRVCGHAMGDFSCAGTVTIEAGGTLDGRIAARSVNVLEGGELRGQFRILESAELEPFTETLDRWHWSCGNLHGKAGCSAVLFDPHS
jgi:hypothetical protein